MSSISNLDALPIPLIIAAQHRPAGAIALDELQIQLGAQDAERGLLRVNGRKQSICILVPLVVRGGEVEDDRVRAELNLGAFLVNFLEVEGNVDSGGSLVEIIPAVERYCQYVLNAQCSAGGAGVVYIPDRIHLLFTGTLCLAYEHVPRLLGAPGNLQELVELQHAALAA